MDISLNTLRDSARGPRKHVCTVCMKTFKRSEHRVRHQRGRHTRERPFQCRYCPKTYGRADVVVRHEKAAHESLYTPRVVPDNDAARASVLDILLEQPMRCHTDTQDSDQTQSEEQRVTVSVANCPSPVSKLATPPATSQAPSTDYMRLPTSTPPPLLEEGELVQKESLVIWPHQPSTRASSEPSESSWLASWEALSKTDDAVSDETSSTHSSPFAVMTQARYHNLSSEEDNFPLALGLMFDPLWNPVAAKRAAIIGYVVDLHCREGAPRDTRGMSATSLISVRPMPLPLSPLGHA